MKITAYIDGACRYNPGPMGIGVWLIDGEARTLAEISESLGHGTNNIAEWTAYLKALKEAKRLGAGEIVVFTDSLLLTQQVRGNYRVRNENLRLLWRQAQALQKAFEKFEIFHTPRENNTVADALSKRAIGL